MGGNKTVMKDTAEKGKLLGKKAKEALSNNGNDEEN